MSLFVNRIFGFAVLAASMSMGVAQAGQQASFHLPFAAHWGKIVLEPGDYSLKLPELSAGDWQFFVRGQSEKAYIMPVYMDAHGIVSSQSYLELEKVDGVYYVTKFESGPKGRAYAFKKPKPTHRENMALRVPTEITVSE